MINNQMQPYNLYVNEPIEDSCGSLKENWVLVGNITAAVNYISADKISDDIRYKDCRYTALTRYKGLDKRKEYRLVSADSTYKIVSFTEITRLSQYLMQEVL